MAATRDRRSTAGNRMQQVLEDEGEDDDFYKTTYGGFEEEEEDGDFASGDEDSEDQVDSDFDAPEDDDDDKEAGSDEDKPKRQKKPVSSKAYREPSKKNKRPATALFAQPEGEGGVVPHPSDPFNEHQDDQPPPAKKEKKTTTADHDDDTQVRKSSRHATAKNSLLTNIRMKDRKELDKKKRENPKKVPVGVRRLTQEELMAEAEKTEKKNVKSLEMYLKLEENRKKSMHNKKRSNLDGRDTITSLSLTMTHPSDSKADKSAEGGESVVTVDKKRSQEFQIFSSYQALEDYYPELTKTIKNAPPKPICPVSRKPARYRDPVTGIPYYDIAALQEIRQMYEAEMSASDAHVLTAETVIKNEPLSASG